MAIRIVTPIPITIQDVASIFWVLPFDRRSSQRMLPGPAGTGTVPDSCQSPLAGPGQPWCALLRIRQLLLWCSPDLGACGPPGRPAVPALARPLFLMKRKYRDEAQVPDRVRDRLAHDNGPRRVRTAHKLRARCRIPGAWIPSGPRYRCRAPSTRIVGLNGSRAGRPFEPPGRCRPGAIAPFCSESGGGPRGGVVLGMLLLRTGAKSDSPERKDQELEYILRLVN